MDEFDENMYRCLMKRKVTKMSGAVSLNEHGKLVVVDK